MEAILFHTESPAFRAAARTARSRAQRETCSREERVYEARRKRTRVKRAARDVQRVREVAAGIKHKTVYIR